MKSSISAWASAALALALANAPAAADVLVFGSREALLHDAAGAAEFSPAGLTQLAKDALGLPTATERAQDALEAPAGAFSPVQADVFAHASGYAFVLTEDRDAPSAVNAALGELLGASMYHKLFPAASRGVGKAAAALASEFRASDKLYCAGSAARCADILQTPRVVAQADGDASQPEEEFTKELAQVAQLTDALTLRQAAGQESGVLYVVALSDPSALAEGKREAARKAAAAQVMAFLAALQTAHPLSGAQVVAVTRHTSGWAAVSRRMTEGLDGGSDEEEEGEEEEEEEESEDELSLAAEDGSNATAAANGTAHSPLTSQDIAEYQIVLWTAVLLAAALILAVLAMGNMDVGRDSLLYAKFTTTAGHRKAD